MKKILIYTVIVSLFLGPLTSCDDMLKEESFGNPTAEDMLQNEENFINQMRPNTFHLILSYCTKETYECPSSLL